MGQPVPSRTTDRHLGPGLVAGKPDGRADRWLLGSIVIILVAAIGFGGGGSKYGLANLVVQLVSLTVVSFHRAAFFGFWRNAPLALTALIGLTILLPASQLIPLPSPIWEAIPGRELVRQSLNVTDTGDWATISVDPVRTLLALTALIPPVVLLSIGWSIPHHRLVQVAWCVVAMGLISIAIGTVQVIANKPDYSLFTESTGRGLLLGTFVNRNSTGLFLAGCLSMVALLPMPQSQRLPETVSLLIRLSLCALFLVAIVLTRSRTALVLAAIPFVFLLLRSPSSSFRDTLPSFLKPNSRLFLLSIFAVVLALSTLVIAFGNSSISKTFERFEQIEQDPRAYIWEDSLYAGQRYWPVGSGMGTFGDVFQVDESIENLTVRRPGRAHNDYIEVLIEAGLPGVALIAGWLVMVIWLAWRARTSDQRWIGWCGASILLMVAAQSITDYPLRNLGIMTVAAFALLMLVRVGFAAQAKEVMESPK